MTAAAPLLAVGEAETQAAGQRLGRALRRGDLLGLDGDVGAGKTVLVRGLAAGLGLDPQVVRSPTFALHHVYRGPGVTLHHIDCYRLGPGADLAVLDLDGLLEDGVVAMEWADYADLAAYPAVRLRLAIISPEVRRLAFDADADGIGADAATATLVAALAAPS